MKRRSLFRPVYIILVLAFLYLPMAIVIVFSFSKSKYFVIPMAGLSTKWYGSLFQNERLMTALKHSLIVAVPVVLVSVGLGTLAAFILVRHRFRGKGLISVLVPAPLIIPGLIWALALLLFLTSFLKLELTAATAAIGQITFCLPFVVLVVSTRLVGFDRSLEEAAMSLGANRWATLREVTLPLMAPGILAAALLSFTISFNEFIVTFFLTGRGFDTLPIYIYSLIRWQMSPEINAISAITFAVGLVTVLVSYILRGQRLPAV